MARATAAALARAATSASRTFLSRDGGVLHALRVEIDHELTSGPSPPARASAHISRAVPPWPFAVEWDDASARDVVLRRTIEAEAEAEEAVVVSALLGPLIHEEENVLPGNVFMKVCVRKKDLDSVLLFDCEAWEGREDAASDFMVRRVSCFPSVNCPANRLTRCGLKGKLQGALKEYLKTKGIGFELTDYVIQHLREKERVQYLTWLRKVEAAIS